MTVSWTADMDQRLLMAVLAVVKLDTAAVEEKWKELFKLENIKQPTKRAIVEHIAKLKSSLGISGGKPADGGTPSTPKKPSPKGTAKAGRKPKTNVTIPKAQKDENVDETGSPVEIKNGGVDSPTGRSTSSTPSARSNGKPQAKRRRGSMSDEEFSNDEATSVKSGDDEFRIPRMDKQPASPTRRQAPRRAKSERKASWVDPSSSEEDEAEVEATEDEKMSDAGEEIAVKDSAKNKDGENAGEVEIAEDEVEVVQDELVEDEAVPETQLVPSPGDIMVMG